MGDAAHCADSLGWHDAQTLLPISAGEAQLASTNGTHIHLIRWRKPQDTRK